MKRLPLTATVIPALALIILSVVAFPAAANELKPGDLAPDFNLRGSDGNLHRLSEYRGQTVVLAWFPKAFTGG